MILNLEIKYMRKQDALWGGWQELKVFVCHSFLSTEMETMNFR